MITLSDEKPFYSSSTVCTLPSHLIKEIEEFNRRVKEKASEEKKRDKVEGLLDFINHLLKRADEEKDSFSDSTELKKYLDFLSQIKEKLENEKDPLGEKGFYSFSVEVPLEGGT